jgi:tRNA (guanine-N7-)-methyltransferase
LDDAPGAVGVDSGELGPLPDEAMADRQHGYVDPRSWFANPERPLEVEIGPGKGAFLIQQARLQPETNFLGVEWAGEFYLYAADRIRRWRQRGLLTNVRMLRTDATEWLAWRVPPGTIQTIHLYFSDPWPKPRHHKKRVVRDAVLADMWRALAPGGEIRIVTDHDGYWAWMEEHFARWTAPEGWGGIALPGDGAAGEAGASGRNIGRKPDATGPFELLPFDRPESASEGELVGTNFERKYRREGRPFHGATLRRLEAD